MKIGEKIRRLRQQYGLTQKELADRCELSKGFISQLENDITSPSIATLVDILTCLGTDLKTFFDDDSEQKIVFGPADCSVRRDEKRNSEIVWLVPTAQKNSDGAYPAHTWPRRIHSPGRSPRGRGIRLCSRRTDSSAHRRTDLQSKKRRKLFFRPAGRPLSGKSGKKQRRRALGQRTAELLTGSDSAAISGGRHRIRRNIFYRRNSAMSNKLINLENITKIFDGVTVLDNLNLYIRENEFLTLLGPSGCGKTTTLRILGGFENPDEGRVLFDGRDITKLPPNKRQLNTVFQKYALFTHMTIAENIAFGLKIKGKSKAYIDDKIKYALKLVNLEGYENRSPALLSGGQQQRIAIARAIVNEPKVLLLDEPLGALDLKLRQDMQYELIRLKNELGITFVYVTHDQEEALTMSDTIVVMNQGYIQQIGTPEDIYNEPQNAFVADFIGDSNIIDGLMLQDRLVEILGAKFPCVDEGFGVRQPVDVVIRPEDIDLVKPEEGTITGRVTHLIFKGVHYEMEVAANGYTWLVHSTDMCPVGEEVGIHVDPFDIQIMNKPESEDEEASVIEE